jgi:hypothetical protein
MRRRNASLSTEGQQQRMEERCARRERARTARREAAARAVSLREALGRPRVSAAELAVQRALAGSGEGDSPYRELLHVVAERAPRLIDEDTLAAFKLMAEAPWVRPASTWTASARGRDTLFRSLSEHLFARFPMSAVLWTSFRAGEAAPILVPVAVQVASGGSLYDAVQSGHMPVPLTRKMCHDVLSYRGDLSFLAAIRRAQVRAAGGSLGLCQTWTGTRVGRRIHNRGGEEFWQGVLAWLCRNPPASNAAVDPLLDYIEHRRDVDVAFTMKGRTLPAVLRGMRQWHGDLARVPVVQAVRFPSSGFQPLTLDRSRRDDYGSVIKEIWHVREILDSKSLFDEGRLMRHCVYSYSSQIKTGHTAIWSVTLEDATGHWRRLTIEVWPQLRYIVQARGRSNRPPEARDWVALNAWAGLNNLTHNLSRAARR